MIEHFLQFEFLRHTFYTGLLIGLIAPLLGTFLVVRRLSFLADALSHVTLAGIAFGLFMEKRFLLIFLSPMYSGMAFSVIGAIFIEKLRSVYQSYQELGIPIVLSGGVGLSVIFIALAKGFNQDLFTYLFGSVSAVSKTDFYMILILSILVLCVVFLFYKELVTLSFDEEHATVSGLQTKHIHFLFIILVAFVIAASMRIVGILLVSALVTLPVAAAMRLAKSYRQLIGYSILFGEFSVILGLILGYYLSIPPGGTIVMIALLILLSTILWKRKRGE
ncbi:MAG TPA: metal ABC transporter permease [Bacillota bacterium]|nr:metal ABC transporter permease [Bacillota bacterium]